MFVWPLFCLGANAALSRWVVLDLTDCSSCFATFPKLLTEP